MTELNIVIIISIIHLVYYLYFQVISDIQRAGMVRNTPNRAISLLRTMHQVNIRTFQRNGNHFGFAWFNAIYLNENLFKNEKALRWTFLHEYYHLQKNHKRNIILHRLILSVIPLLWVVWWPLCVALYVGFAWLMHKLHERYEDNANRYANEHYKE
ncbi:MAG: hypothetical protein ABFD50_10535 [Smithella sp.]